MAYVVARSRGRFEIRESVHTPKGPRARSLANFATLTDDVLERAQQRATRPFDREAVREAARQAATPGTAKQTVEAASGETVPRHEQPEIRHFVEAARRMAKSLERPPQQAHRRDPGEALISLFEFVSNVSSSPPAGPPKPLRFPPLAQLRSSRGAEADR